MISGRIPLLLMEFNIKNNWIPLCSFVCGIPKCKSSSKICLILTKCRPWWAYSTICTVWLWLKTCHWNIAMLIQRSSSQMQTRHILRYVWARDKSCMCKNNTLSANRFFKWTNRNLSHKTQWGSISKRFVLWNAKSVPLVCTQFAKFCGNIQ